MTNDSDSPTPPTPLDNAVAAVHAAAEVHEAAWSKLGRLKALQLAQGDDPSDTLRLRARASQKVTQYHLLEAELTVAGAAVNPPTVAEIAAVQALIATVEGVALGDATVSAVLSTISSAMSSADDAVDDVAAA